MVLINKKDNKGFTLIELLVVISIISLLSTVVLSSLDNARAKARDIERIQSLVQMRTALESYKADNGFYPIEGDGDWKSFCYQNNDWNELTPLVSGGYISKLPLDPLANPGEPTYPNCFYFNSQPNTSYQLCNGQPIGDWVILFQTETTDYYQSGGGFECISSLN